MRFAFVLIAMLALASLLPGAPFDIAAAREMSPGAGDAVLGCGDFLAMVRKTPSHLVFVGCRSHPDRQGKPLRATYLVDGRFAALVETDLVRRTGLRPLRRNCCQWDSPARRYRAKDREFTISMVSAETPVATRKAWGKVSAFVVTVDLLTDEI